MTRPYTCARALIPPDYRYDEHGQGKRSMNWTAIGTIAEVVAAAAVVVSLIYLAVQVRQTSGSVRAATELEAARRWSEFHARAAHSLDMTRIWDLGHTDAEQLTEQEQQRFIWFVAEYFFLVEGLFRQFRHSFLSESSWRPHEAAVVGLLENELLIRWWQSGVSPFSPEFVEAIDRAREARRDEAWSYKKLGKL
jgi:hypothetical protein